MKRLIFFLFGILLVACSERDLPQQNTDGEPLSLEIIAVPQVVNPGGIYLVTARVTGGSGVDSVSIDVLNPEDSALLHTFFLYDDGAARYSDDGDQVAFDGYFSQRVLWSVEIGSLNAILWRFRAEDADGAMSEPVEKTVQARENAAPVLLHIQTPDSLPSGFEGQLEFRVEVADSNGSDDIASVSYAAYKEDILNFEVQLDSSDVPGVFTQKMDKTFAAGKKGSYKLKFKAIDHSGAESEIVEREIVIGNDAPELRDFVHADSVLRPDEGNMTAFLITVLVEDDQSLLDVKDVKLEWKKPDSTYSKNSPFDLYDNGLPWNQDFEGWDDGWRGDENAGDGIYSITGIFDPQQPLGNYELTFYATDFAGNQSQRIKRIVTLYSKEGN